MSELAVIEDGARGASLPAVTAPPSPAEWQAMKQQASVIARSGLAPKAVSTPEKVLVIAMKGRELSIPPMQALSHIHIVEGKPTLSAELMTALVRRAGHKLRVSEWTDEQCVLEGIRADDPEHVQTTSFTAEEAKVAGLLNKSVWKNYRQAMLFSRCVSKHCRSQFADVLMGASYVPEELGAEVDEDGRPIGGELEVEVHREPPVQSENAEPEAEDAEVVEEEPAVNGADEPIPDTLYVELVKLLDDLYEEKSDVMDGHEWFEKEWGKWISDLTRREAEKLVDTVNSRLAKKNQREGAEA